jgi:cell division protease FtsH
MDGRDPPPPMGWNKSNDKTESRPLPPIGGPAAQT